MQRILLLTDHSDAAMQAASYAVHLFGKTGPTYVLLSTHFELGYADPLVLAYTPQLIKAAKEAMERTAAEFKQRTGAITVEQHVLYGPLPAALRAYTEEQGGDIVVMGKRGGHRSAFFGSNTTAVIKSSRLPVLAVPENVGFRPLQRIMLADDHDLVSAKDLAPLRSIALLHDAEVLVAHVPEEVAEGADHWSNSIYELGLAGVDRQFIEAHGRDVADALVRTSHRRRVDMLAVIHRRTGILDRLLHPSISKELALETDQPLLVLQQLDQ